jgi:hypothetical protein
MTEDLSSGEPNILLKYTNCGEKVKNELSFNNLLGGEYFNFKNI